MEFDKGKFGDRYRINSHREKGWNYCRNGNYYITINTKGFRCWFGEIVNGKMIMNDFGRIVEEQWLKSFEMREGFFLDKWVLMPNHLHAIVTIDSPYENILSFEDEYLAATEKCMMPTRAKNSISSLMAGFKSITVSKIDDYIDEKRISVQKFNRRNRLWHINYNDRVIRNSEDLNNIRRYIEANPAKWKDGKFSSERFD